MRVILYLLIVLAVIWLFIPSIEINMTEMDFIDGEEDRNLRTVDYSLGAPLPWIHLSHHTRELNDLDEWIWHTGSFGAILIHSGLIAIPAWILLQLRRRVRHN